MFARKGLFLALIGALGGAAYAVAPPPPHEDSGVSEDDLRKAGPPVPIPPPVAPPELPPELPPRLSPELPPVVSPISPPVPPPVVRREHPPLLPPFGLDARFGPLHRGLAAPTLPIVTELSPLPPPGFDYSLVIGGVPCPAILRRSASGESCDLHIVRACAERSAALTDDASDPDLSRLELHRESTVVRRFSLTPPLKTFLRQVSAGNAVRVSFACNEINQVSAAPRPRNALEAARHLVTSLGRSP